MVTLSELKPGQKARIVRVNVAREIRRRIVEMGLTPGTLIEVERVAPLGDPVEFLVKGYHLTLRQDETANILVDPLE